MRNKLTFKVLLLVGAFAGGLYYGGANRSEDKTVYKDKIITVIKTVRPDGTIISETRTEDRRGSVVAVKPFTPKYSAGIFLVKRWNEYLLETPDYGAQVGYHMFGNLWIKSMIIPSERSAAIGLEFQL